jgi:glycogen(starch) synthase
MKHCIPEIELKSSVIHNGLECPPVEPSCLSFKNPTLLCLGRLIKDKGFDLAIKALKNIINQFPEARLMISGDGPERKNLENQVSEKGLWDSVHFTGWISPDKVPELINKALMVVVPSRWEEPFGLVALQAAQLGRPVVASKTGGIPEVVLDKETGLLFEKENVKDLVEKIMFLIQNPKKSIEMGKAAKKRAQTDFSIESVSKKYESLYKRLNHLKRKDRKA